MEKLVRRVTVVQGSGEHRDAKVVYESDEDDDDGFDPPTFKPGGKKAPSRGVS